MTERAHGDLRFPLETAPEHGQWRPIRDGLYWLRQRLPFSLDHINVYALMGDDGWTAVDTGINSRSSKETWSRFINEVAAGVNPQRLVCTHLHPDHVGLAGWFTRELDCPLWMTRTEYLHCRILVADTGRAAPPEGVDFYRRAGLNEQALDRYRAEFGGFGRVVAPLPESYCRLQAGDRLSAGGRSWRVVVGSGHSPEHACLFDDDSNVLISGDQLLPRISSNVSVWPTEPEANPLGDWLSSCRHLIDVINDETLVCPAHGLPFLGGPARLRQLISSHERKLKMVVDGMKGPMLATDVAQVLFRHVISADNRLLAVGETVAHLNYLVEAGTVRRVRKDDRVWYEAAA